MHFFLSILTICSVLLAISGLVIGSRATASAEDRMSGAMLVTTAFMLAVLTLIVWVL